MSTILAISAIITSLITLGIAITAAIAMRRQGNILTAIADAMLKETKASILQKCTDSYIIIRRQRSKAIMEKSLELATEYYREICDLHWSEYRLYSEGLIPESTMRAWLDARARNYMTDRIEIDDKAGNPIVVRYAVVWKEEILAKGYFSKDDPFVQFMNNVHDGKIDDALRSRL